ncbi:winged helix-turn-helix domain-containing protein [Parabacteroides sp.]
MVFQIQNLLQQSEKQPAAIWAIGTYQVVTRKQLLEEIWGNDSSEESLNNNIAQLRKKLSQDKNIHIQTYPCIGYQLDF